MSAPIDELNEKAKNWNDLPVEMKVKCIGKMDFKTKMCLRATSKNEMRMVDSMKHQISSMVVSIAPRYSHFEVNVDSFKLDVRFCQPTWSPIRTTDLHLEVEKFDKVLQFLKQILIHADIDDLQMRSASDGRENQDQKLVCEMIRTIPKIRVKNFEFTWKPHATVEFELLRKCDERLEGITFSGEILADDVNIEHFLNSSQFQKAKNFNTDRVRGEIHLVLTKIIEKWNEDGVENGELKQRWGRKIPEAGAIRIEMKNDRHVWIRISPRDNYLQCFIVSADSSDLDFVKMDYERIEGAEQRFRESFEPIFRDNNFLNDLINNFQPMENITDDMYIDEDEFYY